MPKVLQKKDHQLYCVFSNNYYLCIRIEGHLRNRGPESPILLSVSADDRQEFNRGIDKGIHCRHRDVPGVGVFMGRD